MTIEQTLTDQERLAHLTRPAARTRRAGRLRRHRDPFPITGWDALVWVVGNATQAAPYYQAVYGMELVAYAGPSTGLRDHHSYVLAAGRPASCSTGRSSRPARCSPAGWHGDGISDIALEVPDVDRCIEHARGPARPSSRNRTTCPTSIGTVRIAAIATYGDTAAHAGRSIALHAAPTCPATWPSSGSPARQRRSALPGRRPRRRQRRARPDGRMGRVLQPGHGLHQHGRVRR